MEIKNSYKVTLYDNKNKAFNQFIEASTIDEALLKAKNTFESRILGLCEQFKQSQTQVACKVTKLVGKYRFGFKGGWVTVDCDNLTIFEAFEKAKKCRFLKEDSSLEIKEIYQAY